MATFQISNKQKQTKTSKNLKMVFGWVLLAVCTFVFLFSTTKLVPFLHHFLLGCLGIFVYPLSVLGFIVSLALLNNKKYVMPKKYAIFLSLSLILFLSIIQLIIIGSPKGLGYGEYVALNYSKQLTACGIVLGFLPSTLSYLMGEVATYILLCISLVVCVAFFVEAIVSLKKTTTSQSPIKLQIREKEEVKKPFNPRENKEKTAKVFKNPKIDTTQNIMLEGNKIQEEKRELSAREKLGLVNSSYVTSSKSPVYEENKVDFRPKEVLFPNNEEKVKGKKQIPNGMSMRDYLLSPPEVDLDKFKEQSEKVRTNNFHIANNYFGNARPMPNATSSEINKNIQDLKSETKQSSPSPNIYEESFDFSNENQTLRRGNLTEIKPEEITNEAEDIIRSVVEQEKFEHDEDEKKFIDFDEFENQNSSLNSTDNSKNEAEVLPKEINENNDDRFMIFDDENHNEEKNEQTNNSFSRENSLDRNPSRESIFSREEKSSQNNQNNPFARDVSSERENILNRDASSQRENILNRNSSRENLFREETKQNTSQSDNSKQKPVDEMQRRRDFVKVEPEKKDEIVKPYKYTRPSLDLITTKSDDLSMFNDEIPMKRVALENALESFGVPAKVQNVVIGPTVTRYEIEMPEGISVKKVLSLDADIAYALSAKGQIRIEAPIPGRSMVGIEVPNSKVAKVSIKDVLQSKEFNLSPSPLTFALGKDINGTVKVCNLQKMPHLLVAGTTGSGKSVCLNSIITSLIYKSSPDEVKFIMIDPKQVELSMYEGLPHMVIPRVITDPTKAVNALEWAVQEMERRFNLLAEERVRNLDEYNKLEKVVSHKVKKMPYIVIIFDEFADFMAVAKNEIEDKVRRIAQKARASGIHLILATQRPSTDVVTGTLKSNLPARIAFKVASRVDSEVILGATGAEKLLGYGDMLYKPADSAGVRIQGCFIDTPETKDIVNFITANNEETFDEEAFNAINNPNKNNTKQGEQDDGVDSLLPRALKICIDNGVASTTMVQRKLAIGYPRAARIIDQMEERGYISSAEGSKQRSVYITIDEFYSIFGDIYD